MNIEATHREMFETCDSQSWVKIRSDVVEMRLHPFSVVIGDSFTAACFIVRVNGHRVNERRVSGNKTTIVNSPTGILVRIKSPHLDDTEIRTSFKNRCAWLLRQFLLEELRKG